MSLLEQKIRVNKEGYQKYRSSFLIDSLEDAYNDSLSRFETVEIDKNYGDEAHQFLKTNDGQEYYFDSFKYIYPMTKQVIPNMFALNTNLGTYEIRKVSLSGNAIVIEDYDFGSNKAKISSYFMTDETRQFIRSDFLHDNYGEFFLQLSGKLESCIEKLQEGVTFNIGYENGKMICTDSDGSIIEEKPVKTGMSFYNNCNKLFNYTAILNNQYGNKRSK